MGNFRRIAAVAASLTALLLLLAESPAAAHAGMESSDPAAGAVVQDPVAEITIVFSDWSEPVGAGFEVIESDGEIRRPNSWESPDGHTYVLHFDPPITGGQAGLQWTIRSADTHALSGGFSFTVAAPAPIEVAPVDDEETAPVVDAESPAAETATVESDQQIGSRPPSEAVSEPDGLASDRREPSIITAQPTIESDAVTAGALPLTADVELNGTDAMRALGLVGRLASMVGSLIAIGAIVFLVLVLRGTPGEGRVVTAVAHRAALLIVTGAVAGSVADVAVRGGSWGATLSPVAWTEALSSRSGSAVGLLLIGAFGLSSGSHFRREPIGYQSREMIRTEMAHVGVLAAAPRSSTVTIQPPMNNAAEIGASLTPMLYRWHPNSTSSGAMLGIVALLAAAVVDGHTVGGSGVFLSVIVTLTHVLAGSVWVGGVVVLLNLLRRRFATQRRIEAVDLAVRYSVLASVSLVGVALAGLVLTYRHLDSISQLWTTGWGQLVLAKVGLVAVAVALGAMNHFVVIPRLVTRSDDIGLGVALKRLISVEIVVLVAVLAVTAQLVVTGI